MNNNKMIAHGQAPLRDVAGTGRKLLNIPAGSVVELLGIVPDILYSGLQTMWYKLKHRGTVGYSYGGFFDTYSTYLAQDVVDIDIATPEPDDPKQFITVDGRRKANMCGELCLAAILHIPISKLLNVWERKSPSVASRIFKGGSDKGTHAIDLIGILETGYDVKGVVRLTKYFRDPLLKRMILTPHRVHETLKVGHIIIGVRINKRTGRLSGSGILHWIVLDSVNVDGGSHGIVTIYNPFMNRMEQVSWQELIKSIGGIDGLVVPRKNLFVNIEDEEPPTPEPEEEPSLDPSDKEKLNLLWVWYLEKGKLVLDNAGNM